MKITRLSSLALIFTALTYALPAASAQTAKDYPSRPIRLIVPNAPGSSVDTLTRIVANKLSEVIGQQLVVDNRAGAGGIIGMETRQGSRAGRLHADRRNHGGLDHCRAAPEKALLRPGEGL